MRARNLFGKASEADEEPSTTASKKIAGVSDPTHRRQPIDLDTHVFELSEEAILREALIHEKYAWLDKFSLTGLPRFDGLSYYNVPDDTHNQLLRTEITRLVETAKSREPYLFSCVDVTHVSTTSYEELSGLVSRIASDCSVVALDNAAMCIANSSSNSVVEAALMMFKRPYESLRQEYVSEAKYQTEKTQAQLPAEQSRRLYFALVDYATGCVARLLVRTANFSQWNEQQLALLAQLAVKLKVLPEDSKEYAISATQRAEDTVMSWEQMDEPKVAIVIHKHVEGKGIEEEHVQMREDREPSEPCYVENIFKRGALHRMFFSTVWIMYHSWYTRRDSDDFHFHAVAYEIGLDRSLVVVNEDKNGSVSTASAKNLTGTCCRALMLVRDNIEALDKIKAPPSDSVPENTGPCYVTMDWAEDNGRPLRRVKLPLTALDSVISVMVPLALSDPYIADAIEDAFLYAMGPSRKITDESVRRFERSRFRTSISVQTSTNSVSEEQVQSQDPDIAPISRSGMIGRLKGRIESSAAHVSII